MSLHQGHPFRTVLILARTVQYATNLTQDKLQLEVDKNVVSIYRQTFKLLRHSP